MMAEERTFAEEKITTMSVESVSPVVLVILDGWGYREETDGNAIAAAHTPVMDSLLQAYPSTLLQASGKDVGLPKGQMGNSEVGHLNIGAGRVVPQELVRISDAAEDGSLFANPALVKLCQTVKASGTTLHLLGLCSDGGVHSHIDHLFALLELAKRQGLQDVCIHAITDGRDTLPGSAKEFLQQLQSQIDRLGLGRIVTLSGRYYAMDRDRRWERVRKAYEVMTSDDVPAYNSALAALTASYAADITDEFVLPVRVGKGAIAPGDGLICFNFRPDRAREIIQAFTAPDFHGFERPRITPLHVVTFTQYDASLAVDVAFPPQNLDNMLGKVLADRNLRQFRTAETEKYAHVTYFLDGGNEEPNQGDDRVLVPSPTVPTYDLQPEMSAKQVTEVAISAIEKGVYSFVAINYANPDMVGHTGNFDAAVQAVSCVDECLGRLLRSVTGMGGTAIIVADHGNVEQMWDAEGNPWTAHTSNPVPFILVEGEGLKIGGHGASVRLREGGRLADIAPTILQILGIPQPPEMTGVSLIEAADYDLKAEYAPVPLNIF